MLRLTSGMLVVLLAGTCAHGAYVLTILAEGGDSLTVQPGDSFALDAVLAGDAGDVHDSALFYVEFSAPALRYEGYQWAPVYLTGAIEDNSDPLLGALPALLDADTVQLPDREGKIDIKLENITPFIDGSWATFGEGTLVTLHFSVPADFPAPGQIILSAVPDTFAEGGLNEIDTTAGPDFMLNVIPEPITLSLFLAAAPLWPRRGRVVR